MFPSDPSAPPSVGGMYDSVLSNAYGLAFLFSLLFIACAFLLVLLALVTSPHAARRLWDYLSTPHATRRQRAQLRRALVSDYPALRSHANEFARLRQQVDGGDRSEWPDMHQVVGIGIEEGVRSVFQRPSSPLDATVENAASDFDE